MKAVNAYYRENKTLDGCPNLTQEQIEELKDDMKHWSLENKPYPSFRLSNNNAEIKRLKTRIEGLKLKEKTAYVGWEFNGGTAKINREDNRLQLFFDKKPDYDTRTELKKRGFHWSPKAGAWQRQLTDNAFRSANSITAIQPITGDSPLELQRKARADSHSSVREQFTSKNEISSIQDEVQKPDNQAFNATTELFSEEKSRVEGNTDLLDMKQIFSYSSSVYNDKSQDTKITTQNEEIEKKPSIREQLSQAKDTANSERNIQNVKKEEHLVEISLSEQSDYPGFLVMIGADDKLYLGMEQNYDNNGHYDNQDGTLLFVSENKQIYDYFRMESLRFEEQYALVDSTSKEIEEELYYLGSNADSPLFQYFQEHIPLEDRADLEDQANLEDQADLENMFDSYLTAAPVQQVIESPVYENAVDVCKPTIPENLKLEDKLIKHQEWQETMKAVNAYYRKHKTLQDCTLLPPDKLASVVHHLSHNDKPFPPSALKNNYARIQKLKACIASSEQLVSFDSLMSENEKTQGKELVTQDKAAEKKPSIRERLAEARSPFCSQKEIQIGKKQDKELAL